MIKNTETYYNALKAIVAYGASILNHRDNGYVGRSQSKDIAEKALKDVDEATKKMAEGLKGKEPEAWINKAGKYRETLLQLEKELRDERYGNNYFMRLYKIIEDAFKDELPHLYGKDQSNQPKAGNVEMKKKDDKQDCGFNGGF